MLGNLPTWHRRALALVLFAVAGGALPASGCSGTDERPADWSYIHAAIINPNCTTSNCHNTMTARAGLDLSDPDGAYEVLVGAACGDPVGGATRNYVDPGRPETSQLIYMMRSGEIDRMPPDIALADPEIDLVETWIREGAPCD
jgi:hypothetical protein